METRGVERVVRLNIEDAAYLLGFRQHPPMRPNHKIKKLKKPCLRLVRDMATDLRISENEILSLCVILCLGSQ